MELDAVVARGTLGSLNDLNAVFAQPQVVDILVAVQVQGKMQAVLIPAHQQAVDDVPDDLAEGQGDDGQIVAPQPQHGHAHDDAGDGGKDGAHQDGQHHPRQLAGHRGGQAHGGDDAGEGAHAHKARVAQGQLTQDTHGQVQRDGHDNISADGHQQALHGRGNGPRRRQDLHDNIDQDDHTIGDKVVPGGLVLQTIFHASHLTLSRGPACPAGRPAARSAPRSAPRTQWCPRAGWRYRPWQRSR